MTDTEIILNHIISIICRTNLSLLLNYHSYNIAVIKGRETRIAIHVFPDSVEINTDNPDWISSRNYRFNDPEWEDKIRTHVATINAKLLLPNTTT